MQKGGASGSQNPQCGHRSGGPAGLCRPAATQHAYLSCEQPQELSARTVLCLILFVLPYGVGRRGVARQSPLPLVSPFGRPAPSHRPLWVRIRVLASFVWSASFHPLWKEQSFGGMRIKGKEGCSLRAGQPNRAKSSS